MNNEIYKTGIIYKLYCDEGNEVFIGYRCAGLNEIAVDKKSIYKQYSKDKILKCKSSLLYEKYGIDKIKIEKIIEINITHKEYNKYQKTRLTTLNIIYTNAYEHSINKSKSNPSLKLLIRKLITYEQRQPFYKEFIKKLNEGESLYTLNCKHLIMREFIEFYNNYPEKYFLG